MLLNNHYNLNTPFKNSIENILAIYKKKKRQSSEIAINLIHKLKF